MKPTPTIASILVVCAGNHCRSPIAEALFRARAREGLTIGSAGLTALEGVPPDAKAQRQMAERGLDISGYRGRQFTPALALASDLILVMDDQQREDCGRVAPAARGRIFLLGHWQPAGSREIPDPFRKGDGAFESALDLIDRSVNDWLEHLVNTQRSA